MINLKIKNLFRVTTFEIALSGLFIALWTVTATYIKINFGPMQAGIYIAIAILTGLIFKPFLGFVIAIIADNLQLLLGGQTWSWLFALLPIIILSSTYVVKNILKIKNETIWFIFIVLFMVSIMIIMFLILLYNSTFSYHNFNFENTIAKTLVWTSLGIFFLCLILIIILYFHWKRSNKDIDKFRLFINIVVITTLVYIIASWVVGPPATIIWVNQVGHTSSNWKLYNSLTIIRIVKTPVSLPIHILIVYSIYKTFKTISKSVNHKWKN